MNPSEFIAAIAPAAQECQKATGIPASFTMAQAALESSWGNSELAQKAFNLFGVKADRMWMGKVLVMNTREHQNGQDIIIPAKWRAYSNWQECIDDRAKFFRNNQRYAACFTKRTGEDWARAVQICGYATDPKYADKVIAVMRGRNMVQFDTTGVRP